MLDYNCMVNVGCVVELPRPGPAILAQGYPQPNPKWPGLFLRSVAGVLLRRPMTNFAGGKN